MQKEHFDRAHRAKDERILKVREQVQFFPQKQHGAKTKWLTGTVIEILERGRSYVMSKAQTGKKYRRNRAHLKPLCHDGSSFQDPLKAKRQILTRHDIVDSFQDPRPRQRKSDILSDPMIFEWIPKQRHCKQDIYYPYIFISIISSCTALLTPFTLIITTSTALSQRASSESQHRGPHCT